MKCWLLAQHVWPAQGPGTGVQEIMPKTQINESTCRMYLRIGKIFMLGVQLRGRWQRFIWGYPLLAGLPMAGWLLLPISISHYTARAGNPKMLSCFIQGHFVSSAQTGILCAQRLVWNNLQWSWVLDGVHAQRSSEPVLLITLKLPIRDGW